MTIFAVLVGSSSGFGRTQTTPHRATSTGAALVAKLFSDATHFDSEQATTLRRSQLAKRWWITAHSVAIAGQSHGRVVAVLDAPEILSAGEPATAISVFAAVRQQEQNHKSAPS